VEELRRVLLASAVAIMGTGCGSPAQHGDWTVTRLDLEVRVDHSPPALTAGGVMWLRLDGDGSDGPVLAVDGAGMRWTAVEGSGVVDVDLNARSSSESNLRLARVKLDAPLTRGDELQLRFGLAHVDGQGQLMARRDLAIASWTAGWYPTLDYLAVGGPTAWGLSFPGTTTLSLPEGWVSLSDGELLSRERSGGRTMDRWDVSAHPVARSFAAGPYRATEQQTGAGTIRIYTLEDHPTSPEELAGLLSRVMGALEAKLGPFPFPGYGVAEVPNDVPWGAASQQTFVMATSQILDTDHGNLPAWAHEMTHGWWGNTISCHGPGNKMASEALAQLGVLIALESLEGPEAMTEFLEFSRSGYSLSQCARGYFWLVEQGRDHPLSQLGSSGLSGSTTHNLVDSKGVWVLHMLRQRVGDEVFYGTLRQLIGTFTGKSMSLDDLREAFLRAAPNKGLKPFFAQWLDRPGAPRFEVTWSALEDGDTEIVLTQSEGTKPFVLDLEIELAFEDHEPQRIVAEVRGRETRITCGEPSTVLGVEVDPARDVLLWRPAYEAPPAVEGVELSPTAPWMSPEVYAGIYELAGFGRRPELYAVGRELWARSGEDAHRLWPHVPHRFRSRSGWLEFHLEDGHAASFTLERDDGPVVEGIRIERSGRSREDSPAQ
jgi:hypothetical protein